MKRLIYVAVIVAMLAIMIVPPMTDSYVGSTEIYTTKYFYFNDGNLYLSVRVRAWEEPSRKVELRVRIRATNEIDRFFPAVELYSEPNPLENQFNKDILGKYYFEEGISIYYATDYYVTVEEDEDTPAVFGRALCGADAGWSAEAIVFDIVFTDGVAPTIYKNDEDDDDLTNWLRGRMAATIYMDDDPFGFFCG